MPSQENIRRTLGDALAFLKNYIYIYIYIYFLNDLYLISVFLNGKSRE